MDGWRGCLARFAGRTFERSSLDRFWMQVANAHDTRVAEVMNGIEAFPMFPTARLGVPQSSEGSI